MLGLYRKVLRVPNVTLTKGIVQTYYQKLPNLYDLIWEKQSGEGSSNKNCIISDSDFCITTNNESSSYTFLFPDFLLNLSGISFLSCLYNRCTYNFDIYALDLETNEWNLIKNVREDRSHFHQTAKFIDCHTNAYTNSLRLVQVGTNYGITTNDNHQFIIRFMDFFGELLMKSSVITFISKPKFNSLPLIFITISQS